MDETTANAVECLVNLLFLIRLRASSSAEVLSFVEMAEKPMKTLIEASLGERSLHKNIAVPPIEPAG